jgi:hypothetical protein
MLSRWRALPSFTRMWVLGGLVWFPIILLEAVLAIIFRSAPSWTTIYVTLAVLGAAASGTFWVLGVIRAVQFARRKRLDDMSISS